MGGADVEYEFVLNSRQPMHGAALLDRASTSDERVWRGKDYGSQQPTEPVRRDLDGTKASESR